MDTCVHWLGIWRIEFSVGIGYLDTEYRKYTSYGNDLVWVSSGKYHFIGPTKQKFLWYGFYVGEMSGMKDARHMILWLFFGLLPMLGSCDFRDMLDDYPVSGVQIKLDWKGVTDKLPQTMRIIFYPKDTQGRKG